MKKISTLIFSLFISLSLTVHAAEEYLIDKAHTEVGFKVKHMVITTVRGKFAEFSGKIFYDENDVSKSSVEGTVQVSSIDTGNEKRDAHLRSGDFFDAEKYPEITFKSKKIKEENGNWVAIGDLTMRGVTKEIRVPFTIVGKIVDGMGKERVGLEATAKINRKDFGVSWNKTFDNGVIVVSDEVEIEIHGEFIKK
ncbi:polyisoprenoid-binding protein [candidate division KSB1 bacterium]|nr:polyisoprenoid-binding protein [candidate division KSB1 bacterium]